MKRKIFMLSMILVVVCSAHDLKANSFVNNTNAMCTRPHSKNIDPFATFLLENDVYDRVLGSESINVNEEINRKMKEFSFANIIAHYREVAGMLPATLEKNQVCTEKEYDSEIKYVKK